MRDLNPGPLRYRCSALPTELTKPTSSWSICWPVQAWIFFRSYFQLLVQVVFLAARTSYIRLFTAVQIYEFPISKIIIVSDISDHSSQFCILKSVKDKVKDNKFKVRNFSQFSADCFNAELSQVDWNAIVERKSCDVNDLFSSFYNKFNKFVKKQAPMKTISKS